MFDERLDSEPVVVVDHRHRNRILGGILAVVVLIILLVFGKPIWNATFPKANPNVAVIDQLKAETAAAEERARLAQAKQKATEEKLLAVEQLHLATIRRGEGPESPYARQLMANPQTKVAGIKPFAGDLSDRKAIKRWAQREAHLIAINNHQFDPKYGREWRVKTKVGAVYLLDTGTANPQQVVDYVHHKSPNQPVQVVTATGPGSHSFGQPGHEKGQPYEYLYSGE